MKHLKIFVAVFLAALMFVQAPVRTLAENEQVYLKEVSIGYGDSGKQKLKDAGYTVYEDLNVNDGGTGESVWIGYKTTTVKSEGITDLAVMNMYGGYSISDYQNMITDLKRSVQDKQEQILAAVTEFSQNYAAGSEYAQSAMKLIDCFYYDADENTQISLKDLFTAENIDKDAIYKMCLEGNTESMNAIVSALSLGLVEYTGKTVLTRLPKVKYGAKSEKTNVSAKSVTDAITTLKLELLEAEKTHNAAVAYEGGIKAYLASKEATGNLEDTYYVQLYEMAQEVKYGDTGLTLFQAMTLPLDPPEDADEEEDSITYIDSYMIDMMTKALTLGQIGVVETVGLGPILLNAYAVNIKITNPTGTQKTTLDYVNDYLKDFSSMEKISVFDGVDRSLIEHPEDVAITTEALRKEAKKKETDVGRLSKSHWTDGKYKTFLGVTIASGVVSIAAGAAAFFVKGESQGNMVSKIKAVYPGTQQPYVKYFDTIEEYQRWYNNVKSYRPKSDNISTELIRSSDPELAKILDSDPDRIWNIENMTAEKSAIRDESMNVGYSNFATNLRVAFTVVAAVALIISIIFTVFTIIAVKEEKKKKIEYTQVPRAIIDAKTNDDESTSYVAYYAVKQITATETETDFKKLYGDLNAYNEYDQWHCLYYSKDSSLGEPLTPNILAKAQTLSVSESEQYLGVHDFGYTSAKDLNYYNSGEGKKTIYVYFEKAASADSGITPKTASLFNLENGVIAISFLALGALGATFITFFVMKKKKKTEQTA